jgi:hypothetical protein
MPVSNGKKSEIWKKLEILDVCPKLVDSGHLEKSLKCQL